MEETIKDAKFFGRKIEGGNSKAYPRLKGFIKGPCKMLVSGALIVGAIGAAIVYAVDFFCPTDNNRDHDRNRGNRR